MNVGHVSATKLDHTVVLQLCRSARSNAYTQSMLRELEQHVETADADASTRVIIVTGEGDRCFSAGADRDELATRDWRSVLTLGSARVFGRLRRSRCLTIAAINGAAIGGGMELALSCDLRLAADHATFRLPETSLGLIPAAGATEILPQLVGPLRAKEMILCGVEWNAETALRHGFLTEVTSLQELMPRATAWGNRAATRNADAVKMAKQAIDASASGAPDERSTLFAQSALVRGQRL
jgi:enoyl-CoA hydratase/carnithine racemase